MAASFPGTLRSFPIHVNTTEVIDASHVNEIQDELVAVQTYVGTNPQVSSASTGSSLGAWSSSSRTYASLSDRIANVEAGHTADTHSQYVRFGNTETITGQKTFAAPDTYFGSSAGTVSGNVYLSSGTTGGQAAVYWRDGTTTRWGMYRPQGDNNIYLRDLVNARQHATFVPGASNTLANTILNSSLSVSGDTTHTGTLTQTGAAAFNGGATTTSLTLSGTLTLAAGTGTAASTSAVGDAAAGGTSTTVARADHLHGRESFGLVAAIQAVTAGGAAGAGTNTTPARSDHVHALGAAANPTTSSVGDAVALGASGSVARADHTHGREGFGAAVQNTIGAASNGAATTVARSDHFHGMPAGLPSSSAIGDVQAGGASTSVARADHVHGREAFGAAPPNVTVTSSTTGGATTVARSDHSHSVTVGSPTAMTSFGLATADGTSTSLSRADHSHGTPPAPTPASVNAVSRTGDTMFGVLQVGSGVGYISVWIGTASNSGYTAFFSAAGVRQGYIGYSGTTATTTDAGTIPYVAGSHAFSGSLTTTGTITENGNRVYSAANPPPISAPVVIMPFFVGGSIGTGLRRPEFIATVNMTIRAARSRSYAGSGTYSIWVNGANISGSGGTFGTAQALFDFTDYNIVPGDRVALSVDTATVDAVDLSVTVDVVTR